jgi:hypothetical protein
LTYPKLTVIWATNPLPGGYACDLSFLERQIMKAAIFLALAMCSTAACAGNVTGGTLHGATLREWHQATSANQYATAADILERFLNIRDPLFLAPKVRDVHACINRVSGNFKLRSQTVADTAIACMAELGYLPR